MPAGSLNAVEGDTKTGAAALPMHVGNLNLLGNRPHKSDQFTRNSHGDDVGVFPSGHESSIAFTQPDLGLPADVLDDFGLLFQSLLEMPPDLGRRAVAPGALDQDASGVRVARFGNGTLPALLSGRIFRGNQAQAFPQLSWVLKAGQVADFCHHGNGHSALDTTESLECLDHRMQTPRFHVLVEFLVETLEACGVLGDGTDVFLQDDVLRRCRADHVREPSEVGRVPSGPAYLTTILSKQEGFAPKLCRLAIAASVGTCPGEIANGFIFDFGDIDCGEIP
jgi:hypothetical protein